MVDILLGWVLREVRETAPCVRHPHSAGMGEGGVADRGAEAASRGSLAWHTGDLCAMGSLYVCSLGLPLDCPPWLHQSRTCREEALRQCSSTSGTSSSRVTGDLVRNVNSCPFPICRIRSLGAGPSNLGCSQALQVTPMPATVGEPLPQSNPRKINLAQTFQQCSIWGTAEVPPCSVWLRGTEPAAPSSPRGHGPQVAEICMGTPRRTAHLAMLNAQREGTMGLRSLLSCAKEPADMP